MEMHQDDPALFIPHSPLSSFCIGLQHLSDFGDEIDCGTNTPNRCRSRMTAFQGQ